MSAPAGKTVDAESAAVFRLAVEVCPSGIIVVGVDGLIKLVNAEIERLFGYSRDELHGRSIDVLLPEELRGRHAAERRHFAKNPHTRHFGAVRDFRARRKDGSEFPVEIGLNPIEVRDGVAVVAAIVDISERKRLERLQDEFVATVSHELRTPMTAIAASLGLLLASSAESLPRPAAHLLQIAHGNCQRLVRMVGDILDLKKLDAGQMTFRFERCDGCALLRKAIEANQSLAALGDITLRLETPPAPVMLHVDPDRFIQVITNLISNALKFSPTGMEVVVALEKTDAKVRITVRDHGAGIPAEFKPLVFQPFTQIPGPRKGGSGLGLSIAQRLTAGLHGKIGFENAPGGGTVFFVELPDAGRLMRPHSAAVTAR
jgi:PAS domain S-box-containing protein